MAATRKSSKRAGRKRAGAKRPSAKKRSTRKKSAARSGAAKRGSTVKTAVRKATKSARNPIATVKQAGEKTWEALKSTTAQMVEGVRDRFE